MAIQSAESPQQPVPQNGKIPQKKKKPYLPNQKLHSSAQHTSSQLQ